MTKTNYIIERYTIILNEEICAYIWNAYEYGIGLILNESEFLELMDVLSENPTKYCMHDVKFMHPEDGLFNDFIDILKTKTFVVRHYTD